MVFKKIIFQNRYVALETPPPFMAKVILNFHFDYLTTSIRGQAWGRREYNHRSQPPRSSFPAEMLFQHWSTHLQACLEVYQLVKVKPKSLTGKRIFPRLLYPKAVFSIKKWPQKPLLTTGKSFSHEEK